MSTQYLTLFKSKGDYNKNLQIDENFYVRKYSYKFRKVITAKEREDYDYPDVKEFGISKSIMKRLDMDDKICLCIFMTSYNGENSEASKFFYGEDVTIMSVKKWFLEYLDYIEEYAKDASDQKITEGYFNTYLNCISNLQFNTGIFIGEELSISCFVIEKKDLFKTEEEEEEEQEEEEEEREEEEEEREKEDEELLNESIIEDLSADYDIPEKELEKYYKTHDKNIQQLILAIREGYFD